MANSTLEAINFRGDMQHVQEASTDSNEFNGLDAKQKTFDTQRGQEQCHRESKEQKIDPVQETLHTDVLLEQEEHKQQNAVAQHQQVSSAVGYLYVGLLVLLVIIVWWAYYSIILPNAVQGKTIRNDFVAEDHHDDHHHEEVDMFHRHDLYTLNRQAQRASISGNAPLLPAKAKAEACLPETGGSTLQPPKPKHNQWLTPEACQEIGLPPLGRMMSEKWTHPPWEWTDSVDGWSRLPFPWDPLQLQMLLKQFSISTRDDPDDMSMPSKLVEQFTSGRCIWKYKSKDDHSEIDRMTPLMCIRIIAPDGKYLVRASRTVLKDGKLKSDERPQWPGRALGQPDDAIEEAAHMISDQCRIPKEILTIRVAEATLTEPRNCNMLKVNVRFFRHFMDAQINSDVSKDANISKKLGLDEGGFILSTGEQGECDNFEWWEASKCKERMPAGTVVREHTAPGEKASTDDEVVLVTPWSVDAVERCLRKNKVNTSLVKNMREDIAQKLENETYHLVHNVKHEQDRSHGDPSIALVSNDGRTMFFAARGDAAKYA